MAKKKEEGAEASEVNEDPKSASEDTDGAKESSETIPPVSSDASIVSESIAAGAMKQKEFFVTECAKFKEACRQEAELLNLSGKHDGLEGQSIHGTRLMNAFRAAINEIEQLEKFLEDGKFYG